MAIAVEPRRRYVSAAQLADDEQAELAQARAEEIASSVVPPDVLYGLAILRLANGDRDGAEEAQRRAVTADPRLAAQARADPDLEGLRADEE